MADIFDIQLFADGDENADSDVKLYDLEDLLTMEHGAKLADRVAYLLGKKLGVVEGATEGNVMVFGSDGSVVDSGYGIATNDEFRAMLDEHLPVSNELALSLSTFTLAVGESSDVTVTRLGDGEITVSPTTPLEGISYEINDNTITFSNASATEGTGVFAINVAGTDIYNPSSDTVTITGTSGS